MVYFGIEIFKFKMKCCIMFGMWFFLVEIILFWMLIIFFIICIDKIIKVVEEINFGNGIYFFLF